MRCEFGPRLREFSLRRRARLEIGKEGYCYGEKVVGGGIYYTHQVHNMNNEFTEGIHVVL
jgi:hypothetical protein